MSRGRRGFTLIELLVVIAIIGILAAMLFPVFARARESARKTQCLANVKNIAMAVQMYLVDYDAIWPYEQRTDVKAGYREVQSCAPASDAGVTHHVTEMNPYLKAPVILDDYIKDRDVWRCPSSRTQVVFGILNPYGGDWWAAAVAVPVDEWGGLGIGVCAGGPYPPGWGGSVTDSAVQGIMGSAGAAPSSGSGAFVQQLGTNSLRSAKTSEMEDPARFWMVAEAGNYPEASSPFDLAYGDWMGYCAATPGDVACCGGNWVDWAGCTFSQQCGAPDPSIGWCRISDVNSRSDSAV